jgi:hypothetical protein
MSKYRKKPLVIEAEVYCEGMEDGFIVYFSGNVLNYEYSFDNYDEAMEFITDNMGYPMVIQEDKGYEIIYENPRPYINTLEGKLFVSKGDYIITGIKSERYPIKADIFEETYELV